MKFYYAVISFVSCVSNCEGAPLTCVSCATCPPDAVIAPGTTVIAEDAFRSCSTLTSIVLADSVTTIGDDAFASTSITSVVFPPSVTTIGSQAFFNTLLDSSLVIPSTVTSIGWGAFSETLLTSEFVWPSHLTVMPLNFFKGCKLLTSYVIPETITEIPSNTFWYSGLENITIPSSVTSIGNSAFSNTNLKSVDIPTSVTSIGSDAFYKTDLTSLTIPSSVVNVGRRLCHSCKNLVSVTYGGAEIPEHAFFNSPQITNVTLVNGVKDIGLYAFLGAAEFTSLALPPSIERVHPKAFAYNPDFANLSVTFEADVNDHEVTFGLYKFRGCNSEAGTHTMTMTYEDVAENGPLIDDVDDFVVNADDEYYYEYNGDPMTQEITVTIHCLKEAVAPAIAKTAITDLGGCTHFQGHGAKNRLDFLEGHKALNVDGELSFSTRLNLHSGGLSRKSSVVHVAVVRGDNVLYEFDQGLYEQTDAMKIDFSDIKFKARGSKFTLLFKLDGNSGVADFYQEETYIEVQVRENHKDGTIEVHQCLRFEVNDME